MIKNRAIWNLAKGATFILDDEGNITEWLSEDIPQPSDEAINAELERLQGELALTALRIERDLRLSKTDWTQLPDVSEETKLLWQPYRQALRDITNMYSSLEDVVWPEKPA